MSRLIKLLAVLVLLAAPIQPAAAETERILSFDSEITMYNDRSIGVVERITVWAEGQNIKRGIFRDIPTTEGGLFKARRKVKLEVYSVKKNGVHEPFSVSSIRANDLTSSGKRIKIGNANVFLTPGKYTYEIEYRMTGQVRSFDAHDEVYWNVTGHGWKFKIEEARAVVLAFPGAVFKTDLTSAYTGPAGSSRGDYSSWQDPNGSIHFKTAKPLWPNEGLTISVSLPKGYFPEPSLQDSFSEYTDVLIGLFGLLLVSLYYYIVWTQVGKDPSEGTIIPRYQISSDISAADARFLYKMGFDNKVFTASILGLAVKGFLEVDKISSKFTLRKLSTAAYSTLTNDELEVANTLFPAGTDSVSISKTNRTKIKAAKDALKKSLQREHLKHNFVKNRKYFLLGLIASALCLIFMLTFEPMEEAGGALFIGVWLSIWSCGVFAIGSQALNLWKSGNYIAAIPITLFGLPFLAGEIGGLVFLVAATSIPFAVIAVLFGLVNFVFLELLKAPTRTGSRLRSELKGLRMYLETAEKDRYERMAPPAQTLEHFEELFPYAMALDVEQEWSERFASQIEQALKDPARQGHRNLGWYNHHGSSFNASSFGSELGSSFSSALSSSVSTSSSGSGGGGSSGGGGGGGGGGGW